MINVREMTIDDIAVLKLPADWMRERYGMYLEAGTGPAWIMEDEGRPLCAFGAAFLWNGVCEAWFNLIEKKNTITQIRTVKRFLAEQTEILKIRRMQATVKCDSVTGKKFVETLGFILEGKLNKYNPDGSDAYMYAKVI